MMRRPLLACTATFACAALVLAGCTFLIDFQQLGTADDTTMDGPVRADPPDVRIDVSVPAPDGATDAGSDARDAIADPDACKGHVDGLYCGGDQIVWPGSKDDLVTCKGNAVTNVRYCALGLGCIRMLNGYPDQCDECATKADGVYCGRDMPGWDPKNAIQRVRCQNKAEVGLLLCTAAGCTSNGPNSVCK
jgi:hypothetical protein